MLNIKHIRLKKISIICTITFMILLMTIFFSKTYAEKLQNNVRIDEKSELIYYLKVKYDGIDKNKTMSTDTDTANVKSDIIHVEDKIPEGLTFDGFVTTKTGTISAIQRSNDDVSCTGRVVDNTNESSTTEGTWNGNEYTYHGLHYNSETRTVSFDVENLQAGCELTVGIITQTPKLAGGEVRKDFYNYVTVSEDDVADKSDTVHSHIHDEFDYREVTSHNVTYIYDETKPENAPEPPETMGYNVGSTVGVAGDIDVYGYEFLGWESESGSLEIENGKFTMPDEDVVLVGRFNPVTIDKYTVKYEIAGAKPEDYVVQLNKEYDVGKLVTVDSLPIGEIINGYKFLGWESNDVTISEERQFIMPKKNVTIIGKFERAKYKVSYEFYNMPKPSNSDQYLPTPEEYEPGETVPLKKVLSEPNGYKFLGWLKEDNFVMPNKDIVIYGEWRIQKGTFAPTITKEIVNPKKLYKAGDKIEFKITVTNTASFNLSDIVIKENNNDAVFKEGNGYNISSDHIAVIPILKSGKSVKLYSEYVVKAEDEGTIINEVEIKGASSNDDYELENKDYKASVEFSVKKSTTSNSNNNIYDGNFYDDDDTPGSNDGNNNVGNGSNNTVGNNKGSNTNNKNNNNNLTTLDSITKYIVMIVTCLIAILFIIICMKKINKKEA